MAAINAIGWIAGALVLATFYLKTIVPLRIVALASNFAFITYGVLAGLTPILVLHSLLLPLNAVRLWQVLRLITRVRNASRGDFSPEMLVPYMKLLTLPAGTQLFAKGDHAGEVFLIMKGCVRIVGRGTTIKTGQMVGVMGPFAPDRRRIDTAVCETEVELGSVSEDRLGELIFQKPEFGPYLLRLIIQRNTSTGSPSGRAVGAPSPSRLSPKNWILWGDHLKVDHPQIDAQHEAIFRIALEIAEIWHRQGEFQQLKVCAEKLSKVLAAHFRFEEKQLAHIGSTRLAQHSAEHKAMLDELQTIHDRVEAMEDSSNQTELGFLIFNYALGVTAGHLSHSDRDDFMVARKLISAYQ